MKSIKKLSLLITLLLALLAPISALADLEARFIDVGQGDSCLITCDGESMLIDGGMPENSSKLVAILKELNIGELKLMINSHPHADHVGGLSGPLNTVKVDSAYSSVKNSDNKEFQSYKKYANAQGLEIKTLKSGDMLKLGGADINVLAPTDELGGVNDNSIVLKIVYGQTSLLFMGDAEFDEEQSLIDADADLKADVLKVGHHGGATSSGDEFLSRVAPEYAIISVGANNEYGHPTEAALKRLGDVNAQIFRTDLSGDIIVKSDGRTLTISASKLNASSAQAQENPVETYYIGNKKSKKFHLPTCHTLPAEKNQVRFDTRDEALEAGYSPCKNCDP